jgi:hypothetical protein
MAGCRTHPGSQPSLPDPCDKSVPGIEGFTVTGPAERNGPRFSFRIPVDFRPTRVVGMDSEVRQWADGAGHTVGYDYGATMDQDHLRRQLAHYAECIDTLGGRPVLIALGHDTTGVIASTRLEPQYTAVATWRESRSEVRMSVIVTSPDVKGLRRGLGVIRTFWFH